MFGSPDHYSGKSGSYFGDSRTDIEPLLPRDVSTILEVGCGEGATMRWLRTIRTVSFATGIELVPEAAAQASGTFDRVIVGPVEVEIPKIADSSYDLILALDVLEHLPDPWSVVRACVGLLKPGGSMVVSIPNIAHYSVAFPLMFGGRWTYRSEGLLDRTHLRFFVKKSAIELMAASGCSIEQVRQTRITPHVLNRLPSWAGGPKVRWYVGKLINRLPPYHLIDFRYLIRVKKPEAPPVTTQPANGSTACAPRSPSLSGFPDPAP